MPTYSTKVVLLGDQGVGKTSIRRNFMGLSFETDHTTTLGVDMTVNKLKVNEDLTVDFQIWDFAGQPAFKNLHERSLLGAKSFVFVFDLSENTSLENISYWVNLVNENRSFKEDTVIFFVGNKKDLIEEFDNAIYRERIKNLVADILSIRCERIKIIATSAKTGENIKQLFEYIATELFL